VFAAVAGLLALNVVMLGSLFSQVEPCPPPAVGPYIGATAALAVFALSLIQGGVRAGFAAAVLVGLMCLRSLGPLNFVTEPDPKPVLLVPVLVLGTGFALTAILLGVASLFRRASAPEPGKA